MIDPIDLFHKVLWFGLGLALLRLLDELETPVRPPKRPRSGVVHWDEARGMRIGRVRARTKRRKRPGQ